MFRQKGRITWLKDGDRNTSFIHKMVKQRHSSHTISQLSINGALYIDSEQIASHIVDFYTELFTSQSAPVSLDRIDALIPRSVSSRQAAMLTNIPDSTEIKATVFSMDACSAPGPDGFGGSFFHTCWNIIGNDVVTAVQTFFRKAYLPNGLNSSTVILIPKKEVALEVTDFRPIVLSNFLFKIISKVLATRLSEIAADIVAPHQYGFLKGKQIHDCIALASEGVNCMERTSSARNMACKIDISKAFDTMSWDFIFRVLQAFGFPQEFIRWIDRIFRSAKLSILVNGSLHGYFSCSRGVRQGDPLSPIIFGLAEDVLSRLFFREVIHQRLKPMVFSRRAKFPSHLLYADDIMLFCIASPTNADTIIRTLRLYGELPGQICNENKSHVFFGEGVSTELKRNINRRLNFRLGSTPFNYLGVPLFAGRPLKSYFYPIRDRILSKFTKWYGTQLSMAGRICLVNSVVQSSTIHSMLVYRWPKQIIHDIDRACKNFIWTGSTLDKPFRPVKWNKVCTPRDQGGLGIRSLQTMNESFMAKLAWKIIKGTEFGFDFLKAKYLDDSLQPRNLRVKSTIWMGARKAVMALDKDTFCSIGDGTSTLFWWDDWLGYRLSDKLHIPYYLRDFLTHKVSDFLHDGAWHFTHSFVEQHVAIVLDILTLPLGERDDVRYWKPSRTGDVTSKEVSDLACRRRGLKVAWGSWIWSSFLPVRRSLVSWRAIQGRLPTFDALVRSGFSGPNVCYLCHRDMESIDHVLWNCPISEAVWCRFLDWFELEDQPICYDINSLFVYAMQVRISNQFGNLWKFGVITLIWLLWMERNACMFEGRKANSTRILASVKAAMVEASYSFNMGTCFNSWADYQRGRHLGIVCKFAPPTSYLSVTWWPPLPHWIKVNTDGSASGCPGRIAAGGVFRNAAGTVVGCFHADGGDGFAFEAELLAVITAIYIAQRNDWTKLWLETDSTYVANLLLTRTTSVPWRFANSWRRALSITEAMDFRVSHIFREGNKVADIMAAPSTPHGWWPHTIEIIDDAVARDNFSPWYHRAI